MKPGDLIADRFEIVDRAASGGMGEVFRAHDRHAGTVVAVKMIATVGPDHVRRLTREAVVLGALRHPAIATYVAHGVTPGGLLYLAIEWVEGETLAERLAGGPLSVADTIALGRRVAEALAEAHAHGVLHRDIKPSNLILPGGQAERTKLIDFGVARQAQPVTAATPSGVLVGSPGYMSPEQVRGDRELDPRVDVFALGCVLHECLTGRAPFAADDLLAVLARIILEEPAALRDACPEAPDALESLVRRMMAKDPAGRPADGAAVAAALAALDTGRASAFAAELGHHEQRVVSVLIVGAGAHGVIPRDPVSVSGGDRSGGGERSGAAESPGTERGPRSERSPPRTDCNGSERLASGDDPVGPPPEPVGGSNRVTPWAPHTDVSPAPGARLAAVHRKLRSSGRPVIELGSGALVVLFSGAATAVEMAVEAAATALALSRIAPDLAIALATGRGVVAGASPGGEAIDRAARLIELVRSGAVAPAVRIDDVTAGLLDARFELDGDAAGLLVRGERAIGVGPRSVLGRESPLIGRDRELGALRAALDECVGEALVRAVLVTGPLGVGKTRLRQELCARLPRSDIQIWIGRGDPASGGAQYSLLAGPLRRAAGIADDDHLPVSRAKLRARIGRNTDADRIAGELETVAGLRRPDDGESVDRGWLAWLAAEAEANPVVLVLEDLQWADAQSVRLVDATLRHLEDRPLLVLALARPEVHEVFPDLWAGRIQEMRLAELTRRASHELVRQLVRGSDAAIDRVVELAGGNPYALEELSRSLAQGQSELPETVVAIAQARLDLLPAEARRILRAASIFGLVFWPAGVAALLGQETGALSEWLAILVDREILVAKAESHFRSQPEYAFRHPLLRETAFAMLTETDRLLGQRLAEEWLRRARTPTW